MLQKAHIRPFNEAASNIFRIGTSFQTEIFISSSKPFLKLDFFFKLKIVFKLKMFCLNYHFSNLIFLNSYSCKIEIFLNRKY